MLRKHSKGEIKETMTPTSPTQWAPQAIGQPPKSQTKSGPRNFWPLSLKLRLMRFANPCEIFDSSYVFSMLSPNICTCVVCGWPLCNILVSKYGGSAENDFLSVSPVQNPPHSEQRVAGSLPCCWPYTPTFDIARQPSSIWASQARLGLQERGRSSPGCCSQHAYSPLNLHYPQPNTSGALLPRT